MVWSSWRVPAGVFSHGFPCPQLPDQCADGAGRALQRHLPAGEPPLRRGLPDLLPARVQHLLQRGPGAVQADQTGGNAAPVPGAVNARGFPCSAVRTRSPWRAGMKKPLTLDGSERDSWKFSTAALLRNNECILPIKAMTFWG